MWIELLQSLICNLLLPLFVGIVLILINDWFNSK